MNTQRTYYTGVNMELGRLMIVVNCPLSSIPFTIWRDITHMCPMSISMPDKEIFIFPKDGVGLERAFQEAEGMLQGAMFQKT